MNLGRKTSGQTSEVSADFGSLPWQAEARRLARQRLATEPGRVAALWAEVEAEAWQEVRAAVKAAMVEALLEELGDRSQESAFSRQLSAVSFQPSASSSQFPAVSNQQPAAGDQPSAISHQPSAIGVYVYGVTDRTELAGLPEQGVAAGHPVTLLPYRDLAAVVSEAPLDEWGEEPLKANLGNMAWLEARVRTHQAVLDAVLPLATLAPMKFATIYLSQEGVAEFLAAHYDAFIALLGHLRGRQEWGLKLYCDAATLAAHIAEISPEAARLRDEIAGKSKGAAYLLARKLQETGDREGERIALAVADRAHTALAERSVAATLNPLQGAEVTGRAERMLLNAAYLVEVAALDAFQAALAEIAAEYSGRGFQFELSGPWPAYNFTRLENGSGHVWN
jgi:hypothetical protein